MSERGSWQPSYARRNLRGNCVPEEDVLVTGNTGIDALYYVVDSMRRRGDIKEAPAWGKRILVLRNTNERPEGVDAGVEELIGTDAEDVLCALDQALFSQSGRVAKTCAYGDGMAATRIADSLMGQPVESSVKFWQGRPLLICLAARAYCDAGLVESPLVSPYRGPGI